MAKLRVHTMDKLMKKLAVPTLETECGGMVSTGSKTVTCPS